jgi:phosphatidate cytidylyltransferase
MLKQRVITAIVMLIVLALTLASSSPWPFVVLLAVGASAACWEWLRLTVTPTTAPIFSVGIPVILFGLMLAATGVWIGLWPEAKDSLNSFVYALLVAVAAVWLIFVTTAVVKGQSDAPAKSWAWSLFSVPATFAAWAVLVLAFITYGAWFVVSLLALVWIADIAAYFAGRAFGKRKLAPKVSPGKTIAGAVAGVGGAVIWVWVSSLWNGSFGQVLIDHLSLPLALPAAALLGVLSIIGDLFESLLKRRAGRKDSSGLLPGHGGVYDRIDAILPVAPFAILLSGVLF